MPLRIVLGRSGTGKTSFCMDEIRAKLEGSPDGMPLILLVPEQATFQTEYTLLGKAGVKGTIRAQVLSFRRLAFRVMQEIGGTALTPINENGKNMLLYKIVHHLEDRLQLFQGAAGQRGFIEKLGELMSEWKRYGFTTEAMQQGIRQSGAEATAAGASLLDRKLHDLQHIYSELESELTGKYIDSEDYLSWLCKGSEEAELLKGAEVWIDGYISFTPKEMEVIGQLVLHAARVTVTLNLDRLYTPGQKPHELDMFYSSAQTCLQLIGLAEQLAAEVEEPIQLGGKPPARFNDRPALSHLERHYQHRTAMLASARNAGSRQGELEEISLHAAVSRRAEVEAAARDLLARVRKEGLRWRDCIVMVRDGTVYNDYISSVFEDCGIPHFLDRKDKAMQHPLTELIRSALETVNQGWRYEAVFRCIKTELLLPIDGPLTREALDRLENYALAAGIDGSAKWNDAKRWKPLVQDSLEGKELPGAAEQAAFQEIMKSRETVVQPLRKFDRALKKAVNVQEMCRAVFKLLEDIDAADRLESWSNRDTLRGDLVLARQHRQLWDGVMNLLDQLVELTGEEKITAELFGGMLEAGLESLRIGSIPPSLDQVLVGSLDRTHSDNIKVCYVLGANDGIMPMRIKEDGLLTDQERERLAEGGIRMAPGARRRLLDERFLIYHALTRPSRHLWVSYALSDEEGKSLLPSEIVHDLIQMFPGLAAQMEAAEPHSGQSPEEQLAFAALPQRALSHLIAQLRLWRQGQAIDEGWWHIYNWFAVHPHWNRTLARLLASLEYTNEEPPLSMRTATELYGQRLQASVSRLERFVSCPFQHFAIHGLRLRERRMHRLGAPDIGQLFHAALSRLAGGLGEQWGSAPEGEIRRQASVVVEELAPRLQSNILTSSSRFEYISRKLTEIVAQAAIVLGEHARRAQFVPVGLELGFGGEGELPALVLPLDGNRQLELVGRIDRVDAAETEEGLLLRVLDYKSSSTALRLEEVAYGLSLQMLAYLDVLLTHSPQWLGREAKPAGVLYFHVHNPLLSSANRLEAQEARKQLLKRFKLKGLLLADDEAVKLMDGELDTGYSELLPVALKREGGFYSSSSVVNDEDWKVLRRSVRRTIGKIGKRITEGEVAIAPYKMGGKSPCTHCAYKPVCQFDPLFEGNDYVRLAKRSKESVWQALAGPEADEFSVEEGERQYGTRD
ncbi:helicase-exonuclease AddAB subunit AddB [Paenibacillus sp. GCM10012307]|uniref:ATP-dependent helicase/deoxyribonuclease subunit B n=2 Tax=Paenibacillus TaxID=44249 RepID=A0A934MRP9_9BACL|nr:helicase-exonuclease AddAB subunit AddB [Paenibacillus roseus]MBJ6363098.1 helicase-exonuclease AddAB subunit AddB [Paenibacillus roseus]